MQCTFQWTRSVRQCVRPRVISSMPRPHHHHRLLHVSSPQAVPRTMPFTSRHLLPSHVRTAQVHSRGGGRWERRLPAGTAASSGAEEAVTAAVSTGRRALVGASTVLAGGVGAVGAARGIVSLVVHGYPEAPPLPPQPTAPDAPPIEAVGVYETRLGGSQERSLRARIFYPADASAAGAAAPGAGGRLPESPLALPVAKPPALEAPYFPAGADVAAGIANLVKFPHFLLAHLAEASSGCLPNAPVLAPRLPPDGGGTDGARAGGGWPALVYSHGFGGNADMACYAMRRLAAEGSIVIAIEHQDGSASHASDGSGATIAFDGGSKGVRARAGELVAVAEHVASGEAAAAGALPPALSAAIDQDCLVAAGHSYGCPTALLACQAAPRLFRAAVLHDPALSPGPGTAAEGGCPVPALFLCGDGYAANRSIRAGVAQALLASAPGSSAWHLAGAEHGNFVDAPFWAPLWVMRNLPLIPAAGVASPARVFDSMAMTMAAHLRFAPESAIARLPLVQPLFDGAP